MSNGSDELTDILKDQGAPSVSPRDIENDPDTSPPSGQWETKVSSEPPSGPPPSDPATWDTLDDAGDLRPGQILFGRYEVDRLLGRGGMGAVWLVRHLELDRQRALKFIIAGLATDNQARGRFQREAKMLARISEHPHAVAIHDARLTNSEIAYIEMEYVKGQSLDRLLVKGRPMPLDWTARILAQLCDVLQFAHDNQIIHRDLKPSNLMLVDGHPAGSEFLKVLDFGIGKIVNNEDHEGDPRTMTGAFMGTPPYTSPEQANGAAEPRSDLYSVGVMLYELLTGFRPFRGSVVQMLTETMTATPEPFHSINPNISVPIEVERVVLRCLAKKPENRPGSARELAEVFRRAVESSSPVVASEPRIQPFETRRPRGDRGAARPMGQGPKIRPIAAGLVLAGLVLVGLMVWASGGKKASPTQLADDSPNKGSGKAGDRKTGGGNSTKPIGNMGDKKKAVAKQPEPIIVTFIPSTAEVTIGGKPRTLDAKGQLSLLAADLPAKLIAHAEERSEYTHTLTRDDLRSNGFRVELDVAVKPPSVVAAKAEKLLAQNCRRCHGVEFQGEPFDVLDRADLVAKTAGKRIPWITPGAPDRSRLWLAAGKPHPATKPQPVIARGDMDLLSRWIQSGAEFPSFESRPIRTVKGDLEVLSQHLKATGEGDRAFQRYFSLASLGNRRLPARTLRQARAALSKSLNSLSWKPTLIIPRSVDPEGLVYAIDLRDFGWEKTRIWERLLREYPYGVTHETDPDPSTRALAKEVHDLSGSEIPLIRADWFIAVATRPPLYHALLEMPKQISELEKKLEVNAREDFMGADLVRAASASNPHALAPRIIDNHMPVTRAFWRTYDVRRKPGSGDIFAEPLGPDFEGHPFPQAAFRPDTQGVLFSLPNGLHGYMLADGEGKRVDAAPTDLLRDPLQTSGTSAVVTGLSCLACHRTGVKRFQDELGARVSITGEARVKLGQLMPGPKELDEVLTRHETRFMAALEKVVAPFLKTADDAKTEIGAFPEPIGPIARIYAHDLVLADIAAELGLSDSAALASDLRGIGGENSLEFATLAKGGTITRDQWQEAFDRVIVALKLGTVKKCTVASRIDPSQTRGMPGARRIGSFGLRELSSSSQTRGITERKKESVGRND